MGKGRRSDCGECPPEIILCLACLMIFAGTISWFASGFPIHDTLTTTVPSDHQVAPASANVILHPVTYDNGSVMDRVANYSCACVLGHCLETCWKRQVNLTLVWSGTLVAHGQQGQQEVSWRVFYSQDFTALVSIYPPPSRASAIEEILAKYPASETPAIVNLATFCRPTCSYAKLDWSYATTSTSSTSSTLNSFFICFLVAMSLCLLGLLALLFMWLSDKSKTRFPILATLRRPPRPVVVDVPVIKPVFLKKSVKFSFDIDGADANPVTINIE